MTSQTTADTDPTVDRSVPGDSQLTEQALAALTRLGVDTDADRKSVV